MKKRILSLLLALCLTLGLSVPALAAGTWTDALIEAAGGIGNVKSYMAMILNSANNAMSGVVTSADGSDVPATQKWVTPAAMATLQRQVDAVHTYYLAWDSLTADLRDEASLATLTLQEAVPTFKNAIKTGLMTEQPGTNTAPPEDDDPQITDPPVQELPFSDVPETEWYYPFVSTVYEKQLFAGYDDGTFRPDRPMSYGEFLGVLAQFSRDAIDTSGASVWYEPFVDWALKNQLIPSAIQEKFDPAASITRQDMAALMGALISAYEVDYTVINHDPITFTDADKISSYAAGGVLICWQAGIMGGRTDGSFDSKATATRAEVAVVMTQLARVMGK